MRSEKVLVVTKREEKGRKKGREEERVKRRVWDIILHPRPQLGLSKHWGRSVNRSDDRGGNVDRSFGKILRIF